MMDTLEAVGAVLAADPDALYVSSLGTPTSALRAASDDGPHLYMGGAMGSALPAALGVADRCPDRSVIGLIGDGDLLMGASALWSFAGLAPANLLVVVLANGRYGITGGQDLIHDSAAAAVAGVLAPLSATTVDDATALSEAVRRVGRPGVVEARVTDGDWTRPTPFVNPALVRTRFLQRVHGAPLSLSAGWAALR
jgi:thiamine pyrophosphate-dependent acetolactate synthase large subunit-like protein